jgi:hypothetical protein
LRQIDAVDPVTAVTPKIDKGFSPGIDVTRRQAEATR